MSSPASSPARPSSPGGSPAAPSAPTPPAATVPPAAATPPAATAPLPAGGPKPVKLKIDGLEIEAAPGTSILQAAQRLGITVPVFCYHPGLSVAGNCRICMVEASNSKKPVVSCATPVAEGIEVRTDSEMVKKARAGVMELMLVNHPLDCPICDKSGECMLQDNSYNHGKSQSRMVEQKVIKHTKPLGPNIWIWGNRCIVCTRCTRFCDEISGTGELCVVERGDHSVIDVFPGYPLDNPLSGNTVDICPVGALISNDFLYQARVWYTKKTQTICTACARGCNIEAQTLENRIVRLVPRENRAVNDWWMCDEGRFDFKFVGGPTRVLSYRFTGSPPPAPHPEVDNRAGLGTGVGMTPQEGSGAEAGRILARKLRAAVERGGPRSVAVIGSAFMSLEELYLLRLLAERLGTDRLGAIARPPGREQKFKGGFVISADKNPNRRGAELLWGPGVFEGGLQAVIDGIKRGEVRTLLAVSNLPHCALDPKIVELLPRLELSAIFLLEMDGRLPASADILPATAFAEKDGSMINDRGRVQRLRPAVALPRLVRSEVDVLQEALIELGEPRQPLSAGGVFRELAEKSPELRGRTHRDLGSGGFEVGNSHSGASPAAAPAGAAAERGGA